MKKILTKISYMAFGSFLTIIGYYLGSVDTAGVNAQEPAIKGFGALGVHHQKHNPNPSQLPSETTAEIIDKIRVRQIEIVGNDDTPRIYLGTDVSDRGEMEICDEYGVPKTELGVSDPGGYIRTSSSHPFRTELPDLFSTATLGIDTDGKGYVLVRGELLAKTVLGVNNYGGYVTATNQVGEMGAHLGIDENSLGGVLEVKGINSGGIAARLGVGTNGGHMTLYNKKSHEPILQTSVTDKGEGVLITYDKEGAVKKTVGPTGAFGFEKKSR